MVDTLTRRQLNRSLLARQGLLERARAPVTEVVERLVGLQAQEPIDPYVGLWCRIVDFNPADLADRLVDRALVRAVALMRTTIHLVSARDALQIRPRMQRALEGTWRHSPFSSGIADADLDELLAAGRAILDEGPIGTTELGRRLQSRWPAADASALGNTVRFLVPVVQPPPRGLWGRGGAARIQSMESWLGAPVADDGPVDDLVLRYLAAFGPATPADVATWSWWTGTRAVLERLRPRLRVLRDERGRELYDVPDAPFPDPATPVPVRLLPEYDNIVLSHQDRARIVDRRPADGEWLRGTILVDGFVRGTWKREAAPDPGVRVRLLAPTEPRDLDAVGEEASRLAAFLEPDLASPRVVVERGGAAA